jgi:hypothetical protein
LFQQAMRLGRAALNALGGGAPDQAAAAPPGTAFTFHEGIKTADGADHEIANQGSTFELTMASRVPRLLKLHPDPAVQASYQAYLNAVNAAATPADRKLAADAAIPPLLAVVRASTLTPSEAVGVLPAYRGIHFKKTWDETAYNRALEANLVGQPTFSAAAREIAKSNTPDGSDVPRADLEIAAVYVRDEIERTKNPASVKKWWGGKTQIFDSLYLAMLQDFVNRKEDFEKELKNPPEQLSGLLFHTVPFISTSKEAPHAAEYAYSGKFLPDAEVRTVGVVGRIFVYLFDVAQLIEQDPANLQQIHGTGGVTFDYRILKEGEITFTGSIPGENLVAQHDARAITSAAGLAALATRTATTIAAGRGGLQKWANA